MCIITWIYNNVIGIIECVIILYGLCVWKKEYYGKKEIDLAEDIIIKFRNMKDIIELVYNKIESYNTSDDEFKRLGMFICKNEASENEIMEFLLLKNKANNYWKNDIKVIEEHFAEITNIITTNNIAKFLENKDKNINLAAKVCINVEKNLSHLNRNRKSFWKKLT